MLLPARFYLACSCPIFSPGTASQSLLTASATSPTSNRLNRNPGLAPSHFDYRWSQFDAHARGGNDCPEERWSRASHWVSLCSQTARLVSADDITPEQIEQLQKARQDARDTRDSLEKSLKQAEERAKTLETLITKMKADLEATRSAVATTERELAKHADAVRKFDEERAQALVKSAAEAKSRRDQAAAAVKATQDKIHAAQDALLAFESGQSQGPNARPPPRKRILKRD